jgi:hypothetical protein
MRVTEILACPLRWFTEKHMSAPPWPPYRVGNPDYIHALGVIASVFNLLEFRFRSLFPIYTRLPVPPAYRLFATMTNQRRLAVIRECLDYSSHPESIEEDVRHFLAGFEICAENRNILMHSTIFYLFGPGDIPCPELAPSGQQPSSLGFQKPSRRDPFEINTYQLTIPEIRAAADVLKAFELYGERLYWHILRIHEPTRYRDWGFPEEVQHPLPSRPALPTLLAPLRPENPTK